MMDLNGKTVLVTGSVQGIGMAIAEAMSGAGARIAVHWLAEPAQAQMAVDAMLAAGAPEAKFSDADMRDVSAIEKMMADIEDWGETDILVNNAGIQKTPILAELDTATWDAIISVNLSGAFHTMRLALPKMAALEYASAGNKRDDGITVNCIGPGWTETAVIEPQVEARAVKFGGDRDKGIADLLSEKQPTRRTSDPSEIGALALRLWSPIAHNITGTVIPVDGGWTAQ